MGDKSSGTGPCSVVSTSKTVNSSVSTDSDLLSYIQAHTQTQGTQVKAVVAGEAAVRPGLEPENRWSGLMAVKASTTESELLLILLACFLIPLSFAQSCASVSVTQTTSDWLAPVVYCSGRLHSGV